MNYSHRFCIYPKDVMRMTGKGARYAQALIKQIKEANNKSKSQLVTIEEFCRFTGFSKTLVLELLKD